MKKLLVSALSAAMLVGGATAASAGTAVPGHQDKTTGVVVGHYTAHYWADVNGAYVWDLGDGRGYSTFSDWVADEDLDGWNGKTVADIDAWIEAEREKLAEEYEYCETVVNYRGDFGGDPYLNLGVIQNHDVCVTDGQKNTANALIVSQEDPRYTGDPDQAIWGTWEYHVRTASGRGNLAQPNHHVG